MQCALSLHSKGDEASDVFSSNKFEKYSKSDTLLEEFDIYFKPKKNLKDTYI